MKLPAILLLALVPLAATACTHSELTGCGFNYGVVMRMVISELSKKLGADAVAHFDTKDPTILFRRDGTLLVSLLPDSRDGDLFDVIVDVCTYRIVDSHLTSPFPAGPPQ
jgi:hypothetical protein